MASLYRRLSRIPILGWLLRWVVAIIRLPRDRDANSIFRQSTELRLRQLETELRTISASAHKLVDLKIEPTVLRNLGESVPVSLRALRRDIESLRTTFEESTRT